MAFPMPHIQKATSWVGWQTGLRRAKMAGMVEVEGNNTIGTTEVTILNEVHQKAYDN
jgi:hypothetical protein